MLMAHANFTTFYAEYAPKIWGLLVEAKLPAPQAEAILINTFVRGWQASARGIAVDTPELTRLLSLACEEGLPQAFLHAILAAEPPHQRPDQH